MLYLIIEMNSMIPMKQRMDNEIEIYQKNAFLKKKKNLLLLFLFVDGKFETGFREFK